MRRVIFSLIGVSLFLGACVQVPAFKDESYASIKSDYPIVSSNGDEIKPVYALDIKAGKISLVIAYQTYRHEYYCTFTWVAAPNTAYEVTHQESKYPLTLYRWERKTGLWVKRVDPIDPSECSPKQAQ